MKTLGSVPDWCSLSVEIQQFTVAEVLPFASFEKWSVFIAPDPMFISGSSLVQCQNAQECHFPFTSSNHVQPMKISLYFILYFAAIVPIQCRQMLHQEYIAEEPSVTHRAWVPNLTVFPKQLAACTPFLHIPLQTQVTPYLFLVSLDWAVLMVLPSWVISLSWEAGASLTASGSTTVSWVTGKTSSSAPCCPKCCLA